MTADAVGRLVDAAIPIVGALVCIGVGLKPRRAPAAEVSTGPDRSGRRRGLVVLGLALLVVTLVRLSGEPGYVPAWKVHATPDGACQAEFPGPPVRDTLTQGTPVPIHRLVFSPTTADVTFRLTAAEIHPDAPALSDEQWLDAVRDELLQQKTPAGSYRLVSQRSLPGGRELELRVGERHVVYLRAFVRARRLYRGMAVAPDDPVLRGQAKRFADSVRVGEATGLR